MTRKRKDLNYQPHTKRRKTTTAQTSALMMRTLHQGKTGVRVVAKEAYPSLTPNSKAQALRNLSGTFQTIPNHSELKTPPGAKRPSPSDSPADILVSPNNTEYNKIGRAGALRFYMNQQDATQTSPNTEKIEISPAEKEVLSKVKEVSTALKRQEHMITQNGLKQTRQEFLKNNNRRPTSQNRVATKTLFKAHEGSAKKYAKASGEAGECIVSLKQEIQVQKWEWLHLIPYMVLGEASQDINNFICDRDEMNTWMLLCENLIKPLSTHYPDGFQLEVEAELKYKEVDGKMIPTHHPNGFLKWRITTPDFSENFDLDTQYRHQKPHYNFSAYLNCYLDELLSRCLKSTRRPS